MNTHLHTLSEKPKRIIILALIIVLVVSSVSAGLLITTNGITSNGNNGITYSGNSGGIATPLDSLLAFSTNGITAPTTPIITQTGSDGSTFPGLVNILATGVDSGSSDQVSGINLTSPNGFIINSGGNSYQADSVFIQRADGLTFNFLDNLGINGAEGLTFNFLDGLTVERANGLTFNFLDNLGITGAEGLTFNFLDGPVMTIPPGDVTIIGSGSGSGTDVSNVIFRGADSILITVLGMVTSAAGLDGLLRPEALVSPGLRSVDSLLAKTLDDLTDDSNVNAAVVYRNAVTDADIATLRQFGVLLGQRYRVLPVVSVTATKGQIKRISELDTVRSIYSNRSLKLLAEPGNGLTGTERVKTDAELTAANGGQTVIGRNVTVAVLDTGLDGTHGDLSGRVVRNALTVGLAGLGVSFSNPLTVEGLPNTDPVSGHGTFVGGVIAGNGARSSGRYTGVAPGAKLVGVSAGILDLISVIEAFDYILWKRQELGIKVVNCSFSADTLYDPNDPVNVATRMLTDRGVSVVFSAGNNGPGMDTLNPYAMAPWVVSVGAADEQGQLADFSSRGSFTKLSGPSLVAPGANVVSLRATGVSLTGLLDLGLGGDINRLSIPDRLNYSVGSGTSFSAPQVAGTIALMLDVRPSLTPYQIKDILMRTATPMPPYYRHEVGAGMLNAHAAVLEAAFPTRRMGMFRATLDRKQARYVNEPLRMFSGTVPLGLLGLLGSSTSNINIPQNTLTASVQVAWGPLTSINDLSMQLINPSGGALPVVNTLNLPVLTGRRERAVVKNPAPGTWRVKLTHTLIGTPQSFTGTLETTRAEYPPLSDISGLPDVAKAEVYQNLRSYVMATSGNNFRPQFTISRYDLASALMVGGRVPQYMAGQQRFTDVTDRVTRNIVESVQSAPDGPLFNDASPGGPFRPTNRATRLTAAIALVRAAGLRSQADSLAGTSLPVSDATQIPSNLRGYVKVALDNQLMAADGQVFRPNDAMKRHELAKAMSGLARLATQ
ncbi:MAG TPA: S8 family serine peptidase [Blastocatellia bacterium]|nr:S8 family serine peptidase [Blastocatellia bacterium]